MNRTVLGFRLIITFFAFLLMGLILDFPVFETPINVPVRNAEARIGRPATPASVGGARASSDFFNRFEDPQDLHFNILSTAERRLIAEWLDVGAQYYNNPFDAPIN